MKLIRTTTQLTTRVAAAGAMGLILVALPAAKAVAHPHPAKSKGVTVTVGNLKAAGGTAALTLDPAVVSGATALGVTIAPVAPATGAAASWALPITAGRFAWLTRTPAVGTPVTKVLGGSLRLGGGFSATRAGVSASVSDLVVDLEPGNHGRVFARVNASRHRIAALQVTDLVLNPSTRSATATLNITRATAAMLNKALSMTSFKAGQKLGTVAVTVPAPV
jgi:hypothetical protein